MDTLTQAEIVAAYEAKVITAERAMALLSGYKKPEAAPVLQPKLQPSRKRNRAQVFENARRPYSAADEAQIIQGIRNGYSQRTIAKTLSRSQGAINFRVHLMRVRSKTKPSTSEGQSGMQL